MLLHFKSTFESARAFLARLRFFLKRLRSTSAFPRSEEERVGGELLGSYLYQVHLHDKLESNVRDSSSKTSLRGAGSYCVRRMVRIFCGIVLASEYRQRARRL